MINELIFLFHCFLCAAGSICALYIGAQALCAMVALQCILSNLLVLKQAMLFGYVATVADPFSVGAILGLNLSQEFYGKAIAKKSITISFGLLFFYTLMTIIHLLYVPAAQDSTQAMYLALFSHAPRITLASLGSYYFAQNTDFFLYGWLSRLCSGRYMIMRSCVSVMLSQAIDTIMFTFVGLGGLVAYPWQVIIVSYVIKLIAIFISITTLCTFFIFFKKDKHPQSSTRE
jgi:uncharacterized integral membrane protein (TIGR00697 family)